MGSKIKDIVYCLFDLGTTLEIGYSAKEEGNFINKYNGGNADNSGLYADLQLLVKRTGTNVALRYEQAEQDARNIMKTIKENFQVVNDREIPLGDENNSFSFVINFRVYEQGR